MELVSLALVAFFAGLVDAIAGGGGLLQVPGLQVFMQGAEIPDVFGTNKGSSIAGTAIATWRYARAGALRLGPAGAAAIVSLPCSYLGAMAVRAIDPTVLRPLVFALLFAVFVFTLRRPSLGDAAANVPAELARRRALMLGAVLGFYDGFFGPGTGTFLVFGFVRLLGMDFLRATAAAKLVNLATNVAALALFAMHGNVRWHLALPMAAANVVGAVVGTRLAMQQGAPLVRKVFLAVVIVLLGKLAFDLLPR